MFDPRKLMDFMKQASEMQSQFQDQLKSTKFEGQAGGGMVKVTLNGQFEVLELTIDQAVVDKEEIPFLQDLVAAAINDAVKQARDGLAEQMKSMTGKLGL